MHFANPWGLLGLLAVPAILAIHFFHRRYPPLLIAGSHLWGIDTEVQTIGRRFDRLPLSASLILELLAAVLLTLLLSQPRLGVLGSAQHLVVVLDHSASMQSAPPNGMSFREKALEILEGRMEGLPAGSRVTVILSGPVPQTIAGPAERFESALLRLDDWQPHLPKHSFQPAWDRAAQFADTSGQMLFLTDQLLAEEEPAPEGMEVIAVGEPLRNVAITTAEWTYHYDRSTTEVYLRIANFGPLRVSAEVKAVSGGDEVFSKMLEIAAGSEEPLQFDVPKGTGTLNIEVFSPADGLALDNAITLSEPRPRVVKVSVELPKGSAAEAAVDKVLRAIPGVERVSPENADLQIGAASLLPASDPELWWLGIGPLDPSDNAMDKALDLAGPYVLKRDDDLVRGLELRTLRWGGVQPMTGKFTPLVSCDQSTLLARLEATFTKGYLLNIDFARSQLEDSDDWPILMSNLLELRRKHLPGLGRWNYRQSESVRFVVPRKTDPDAPISEWNLIGPVSSRSLTRGPGNLIELETLEQTGLYELKEKDAVRDRFAVNFFDAEESDLGTLGEGQQGSGVESGELFRLDNPYSWLILVGLLLTLSCVVADWKSLRA